MKLGAKIGLATGRFPTDGLWFGKVDEKPPLMTREAIERRVVGGDCLPEDGTPGRAVPHPAGSVRVAGVTCWTWQAPIGRAVTCVKSRGKPKFKGSPGGNRPVKRASGFVRVRVH